MTICVIFNGAKLGGATAAMALLFLVSKSKKVSKCLEIKVSKWHQLFLPLLGADGNFISSNFEFLILDMYPWFLYSYFGSVLY